MSGCLCLFGILKIFDEILLLHCFLIETPPLSGKILITTALHNSIHCFDTTLVRCAKAIPKLESKYNTLSLCLLLWLLAPSLWLLIYCVPFSYWVLPSFTQCVLFLTQRINTPSLLSLLSCSQTESREVLFSLSCYSFPSLKDRSLHNALHLPQHNYQPGCNCLRSVFLHGAKCSGWTSYRRQNRNAEIFRGIWGKSNYAGLNIPSDRKVQLLWEIFSVKTVVFH